MSYGAYITIDTSGPTPADVCDLGNYTYNVSPMYDQAIEGSLTKLNGMLCSEAVPKLETAIAYMIEYESELLKLNPPNKWGDYSGALDFLKTILTGCQQHPKATLRVS